MCFDAQKDKFATIHIFTRIVRDSKTTITDNEHLLWLKLDHGQSPKQMELKVSIVKLWIVNSTVCNFKWTHLVTYLLIPLVDNHRLMFLEEAINWLVITLALPSSAKRITLHTKHYILLFPGDTYSIMRYSPSKANK